jgi:hypothetical protein
MSNYDRTRVDITEEEHRAAEAADAIIDAFRDGVQFEDIRVFGEAKTVGEYIRGTEDPVDKGAIAERLIALGFALYRDNVDIDF